MSCSRIPPTGFHLRFADLRFFGTEGGKDYDGFVFARLPAGTSGSVSLVASLEDYTTKKTLATQTLKVTGTTFARYNFSFTPSASTTCVDIAAGSDPNILCGNLKNGQRALGDGHTCVRCGGQFKLSLSAPGAVLLNYVYLQPGQWGRVPGLP